jgi:hypothetical protein
VIRAREGGRESVRVVSLINRVLDSLDTVMYPHGGTRLEGSRLLRAAGDVCAATSSPCPKQGSEEEGEECGLDYTGFSCLHGLELLIYK